MSTHAMDLPAGRELDAMIAERIMGLNVVARNWPCGWAEGFYQAQHWPQRGHEWFRETGPVYAEVQTIWPPQVDPRHPDDPWGPYTDVQPVPFYSTDITAAWQVLTHLQEQGYVPSVSRHRSEPDAWWACFSREHRTPDDVGEATGDTAPLAICRAALAAVEASGKVI